MIIDYRLPKRPRIFCKGVLYVNTVHLRPIPPNPPFQGGKKKALKVPLGSGDARGISEYKDSIVNRIVIYVGLAEKVYVVEKRGYTARKMVGLLLNSQI